MYSVGMEEEYFVFDAKTRRAVRRIDKKFLALARKKLGDRVMTEMLQSQIEVATPPCATMQEARDHLAHYRGTLAQAAAEHKLGLAAMGTFPLAFWPEQIVTPKARYGAIMDDLQMIGYRNMLCGMHVHVEVPDLDTRINLIMRLTPYLPLLLALSTSSPFWQGHLTGLCGYRLAAYDELPRTGLPELFRTKEDYDRIRRRAHLGEDHPGRQLHLVGVAAVAGKPDRRIAHRRQLHAARRCRRQLPRCSAAWCARSTATARSMPASTASGAPSRKRTSGTPSATASPPPSSIRFRARRSRSSNGSTRCSISSPRTSTRSAARRTSGACTGSPSTAPAPTARSTCLRKPKPPAAEG